jgi:hypothetical protein
MFFRLLKKSISGIWLSRKNSIPLMKGQGVRDDLVDALAYACWAWRGGSAYRFTVFEEMMRV